MVGSRGVSGGDKETFLIGSNKMNVIRKGCTHPDKTNRSMSYRAGNQIITLSEAVCGSDLCNKPNPGK